MWSNRQLSWTSFTGQQPAAGASGLAGDPAGDAAVPGGVCCTGRCCAWPVCFCAASNRRLGLPACSASRPSWEMLFLRIWATCVQHMSSSRPHIRYRQRTCCRIRACYACKHRLMMKALYNPGRIQIHRGCMQAPAAGACILVLEGHAAVTHCCQATSTTRQVHVDSCRLVSRSCCVAAAIESPPLAMPWSSTSPAGWSA